MPQTTWCLLHPMMTIDMLGAIPFFLDDDDPRPAREQFDEHYAHGGGWRPVPAERVIAVSSHFLKFLDDPPLPALAETQLHEETIRFYTSCWVAIVQPNGSYEVARMD